MSPSPLLQPVAEATERFLTQVLALEPSRLEAKVASADGMPLLCAVEEVLARQLSRVVAQELVWLNGPPVETAHVLSLQAFGAGGELLAKAEHRFAGGA